MAYGGDVDNFLNVSMASGTADTGPSDRRSRQRGGRTGWACLTTGLVFAVSTAAAQHRHPPQDEPLHEKFYSVHAG